MDRGVVVREGGSGREVYFKPGGSKEDIYGTKWTINGEWATLDLLSDMQELHNFHVQ